MPPFAKITIRLARNARLVQCYRFDGDFYVAQQVIESPAENRISVAVDNHGSLDIAYRRHAADLRSTQCFPDRGGVWFILQDRDNH